MTAAKRKFTQRDFDKVARALLRGAKKRKQAFGDLFDLIWAPDGKAKLGPSCAMGAIYEGGFGTPKIMQGKYGTQVNGGTQEMYRRLKRAFPVLLLVVPNPLLEGDEENLLSSIIYLNDDHYWSRGKIAAWIKRLPKLMAAAKIAVEKQREAEFNI